MECVIRCCSFLSARFTTCGCRTPENQIVSASWYPKPFRVVLREAMKEQTDTWVKLGPGRPDDEVQRATSPALVAQRSHVDLSVSESTRGRTIRSWIRIMPGSNVWQVRGFDAISEFPRKWS